MLTQEPLIRGFLLCSLSLEKSGEQENSCGPGVSVGQGCVEVGFFSE